MKVNQSTHPYNAVKDMAAGETPRYLALQKEENNLYETEILHPNTKQTIKL